MQQVDSRATSAHAANLLAKHIHTFPAPGTPITGLTDAVEHDIDTGSTRPIRCNPRKLSPKKIKIQQELVDQMLEEGQIEHNVSAWSAPTVLVTKKDGSTRFCVDYRRLNARTKKGRFSPSAHRRFAELLEWTSLVFNPRLGQRVLASEIVRKRETKNSVRNSFRIVSVCCNALRIMQRAGHI